MLKFVGCTAQIQYTSQNYIFDQGNHMSTAPVPSFEDVFRKRIEKIEADARTVGLNFTSICKEAGISRATPDRWKRSTPKTIEIVQRMENIVASHRAESAPGTGQ